MQDHVVFITGGNSGIGLATALAFANEGTHVALYSRRKEKNEAAREQIEALGVKCLSFEGDVTDEAALSQALNQTVEELGGLHYAFNNAGIEQVPTSLTETDNDTYDRIMDVNVKGVFTCIKHQAPLIQASGGGCIVNTSSVAGHIGMAQVPVYIASKHAVEGLTKAIALEYAQQGVRINAVSPAAVHTDLYSRFTGGNPEIESALENMHPMGRSGSPDEVASAVIYLCRDATWTTGQSVVMDGGFTAQ